MIGVLAIAGALLITGGCSAATGGESTATTSSTSTTMLDVTSENGDGESDDGHHESGDVVLLLDAGDASSVVVTFPEDVTIFTEVACLLPGHYKAGMFADVRYTD